MDAIYDVDIRVPSFCGILISYEVGHMLPLVTLHLVSNIYIYKAYH